MTCEKMACALFFRVLEVGAIDAAAHFPTYFIYQAELKRPLRISGWFELRHIDVIAESQAEVVEIEAGRYDKCILQHPAVQFVCDTAPKPYLKRLAGIGPLPEAEPEARTGIHLHERPLAHKNDARQ